MRGMEVRKVHERGRHHNLDVYTCADITRNMGLELRRHAT